jgi:6-phospho-3-hexuloisomerase
MDSREISRKILNELSEVLNRVDPMLIEKLVDEILSARRVFVAGAGRSLLMIRGVAMRLMQFDYTAFVVGETVTPAIEQGDLLILGSGSGETSTLKMIANNAKKAGAKLALITIYPESTIGQLADLVVKISAPTAKLSSGNADEAFQPGANLFEQSLLILSDTVMIRLIERTNLENPNQLLMERHANLE